MSNRLAFGHPTLLTDSFDWRKVYALVIKLQKKLTGTQKRLKINFHAPGRMLQRVTADLGMPRLM